MKRTIKKVVIDEGPWVYLVLVIAAALSSAILLGFVIHQQHQIREQAEAIQQERVDSIIRACRDQNARHDVATTYLNQLLKKSGVSVKRRRESQVQIGGFINALAPKHDCPALAQRTIHPVPLSTNVSP